MAPALIDPPDVVTRVGRLPEPFDWPPPPTPMAPKPRPPGGYRWDDPRGRFETLYVATEATGAFIETLQDFRPRVDLRDTIAHATDAGGGKIIRSSGIPESYFNNRALARSLFRGSGRFVDVDHPTTHAWLTEELPDLLIDIAERRFERSTMMTNNRRVTRTIAGRLFELDEVDGVPVLGIRYVSKIGDFECWAVWNRGASFEDSVPQAITRHTPELVHAAELMEIPVVPAATPPRGR